MDSLFSFPVGLFHPLVGSRTGAVPRNDQGPSPIPATSNPAGGFPALSFPVCFSLSLCGWFGLEVLSRVTRRAALDSH
jgi:hypothetical protein